MLVACALLVGPVALGRAADPRADGGGAARTAASSASKPAASAPADFAALLSGFESMPGFEARFEESKTLALLAAPLRSQGRLYFSPPATLLRRVETPSPHDILVHENRVQITDGREEQILDLSERADVRPLVESMIWIFAGEREKLEATFEVEYTPNAQGAGNGPDTNAAGGWVLSLRPRGEPLSLLVAELRILGHGQAAEILEVRETAGDHARTRIFDADPQRRFAEGELLERYGAGL